MPIARISLMQLCRRWGLVALALLTLLVGQAQQLGRINYEDWKLETAEEFNTPLDTAALGQRWRYYFPWGRTIGPLEAQYYTSQAVSGGSGVLNLSAQRLATPIAGNYKSMNYTSGMLMSRRVAPDSLTLQGCNPGREGYSYGLFEIRCRQPRDDNSFPAFWLYGGAPDEVDIFEASPYHFSSTCQVKPSSYWRPTRTATDFCSCYYYDEDPAGNLSQQFHTYGFAWLPNEITFYYDGVPIRHETRLLPGGCAMWVIANLAVWNWATAARDTLAIDYIRVYTPRALPPVPVVQRPSGAYPQPELAWLPFEQPPGRFDAANVQRWTASPRPTGRLNLELTDNYNPVCNLTLPLPVAGHWAPAWVQTQGTPELQVRLPPGADSSAWAVHDALGRKVAQGRAGGGVWRPALAGLPPGNYALHLRSGRAATVHPLLIVGRPAGSTPTEAWRQPALVPPTE